MALKGITISEPWASKIASGEKWIENRTWFTGYRGWLAIHAGRGQQYLTREQLQHYPAGHIIAVARLTGCVTFTESDRRKIIEERNVEKIKGAGRTWLNLAQHEFAEGPQCWILEDVRKLTETIPFKGMQGLWDVPEEVTEVIRGQLGIKRDLVRG